MKLPKPLTLRVVTILNELRRQGCSVIIQDAQRQDGDGRVRIKGAVDGKRVIFRTGTDGRTLLTVFVGINRIRCHRRQATLIAADIRRYLARETD